MKRAIVITGGIGSGKSEALRYMISRGFAAIDADLIARAVFEEKIGAIEAAFGTRDRAAIAEKVFSSAESRRELEAMTHPAIRDRVFAECERLEKTGGTYFADIPLFFENERDYAAFKRVLLICAPLETRLKRLTGDRGMSEVDAIRRVEAQMPIELKRARARWVIENAAEKGDLYAKLDEFIKEIDALR